MSLSPSFLTVNRSLRLGSPAVLSLQSPGSLKLCQLPQQCSFSFSGPGFHPGTWVRMQLFNLFRLLQPEIVPLSFSIFQVLGSFRNYWFYILQDDPRAFPQDQIQAIFSWQQYPRNDAMLFSVPHIRGHTMPTCLLTGNVNLDHTVMLVSAGFSALKTPYFFFIISISWEDIPRLCQHPVFHEFSRHYPQPPESTIIVMVPRVIFYFHQSLCLHLLVAILLEGREGILPCCSNLLLCIKPFLLNLVG